MLIDTFINSIFLYDDKMVITFNYKEGTKTITFAELQEAISNKNGSDLDCLAAPCRSKEGFAPTLFCKFSQTEKARRFKPTCFLSCKMTLKLFSVFRRSRLRGHRQIRRCDLHRSHRRGCRQSLRSCRLRRNHRRGCCRRSLRSFRCQSRLRGRCCRIRRRNYRNRPRAVSAAGAGGGCRRRSRRCAAVWVRPAEDEALPNGADAGHAGDGAPRR